MSMDYLQKAQQLREHLKKEDFPVYEHFKGKRYEVIGIARHSETQDELVVYRELYDDKSLWVRPLQMFLEEVERDGVRMPRFRYVGETIS